MTKIEIEIEIEGKRLGGLCSYVEMTIAPSQAEFARQRMEMLDREEEDEEKRLEEKRYNSDKYRQRTRTPDIHLFCADAAKPAYWSDDIQHALQSLPSPQKEKKTERTREKPTF